jgi:hypothetical protein
MDYIIYPVYLIKLCFDHIRSYIAWLWFPNDLGWERQDHSVPMQMSSLWDASGRHHLWPNEGDVRLSSLLTHESWENKEEEAEEIMFDEWFSCLVSWTPSHILCCPTLKVSTSSWINRASLLICSSRRGRYTHMSTKRILVLSIFAIKLLYENNEKIMHVQC